MRAKVKRLGMGALCVAVLGLTLAPLARAAFDDPLFVVRPAPPPPSKPVAPPPDADFEAPCGIAVDAVGRVLVSEYYLGAIDIFRAPSEATPLTAAFGPTYPYGYISQVRAALGALEGGPCGMAFDAGGSLYLYDYHQAIFKLDPSFSTTTPITGAATGVDETYPTGVGVDRADGNVFVNQRSRIAVFDASGTLLRVLGESSLEDGYGVAVSEYSGSEGLVYVADAASDTVKVYAPEPLDPDAPPVAEIDGSGTPLGHFVSLRDAALAVDRATGLVYVTDNLQPEFTERPESVVYVFDAAGDYQGRLKYSIENAVPPGLAVDNSDKASHGRVYVTSGNTEKAAVYAYGPGSATTNAVPVPLLEEPPEDPAAAPTTAGLAAAPPQAATFALAPSSATEAATPEARARARARRRAAAKARRHARLRAHKRSARGGSR